MFGSAHHGQLRSQEAKTTDRAQGGTETRGSAVIAARTVSAAGRGEPAAAAWVLSAADREAIMSDPGKLGSAPGGPGSIAGADRVPDAGTKGIASGGAGIEPDPAGSRLAGKGTPAVPGGGATGGDLQPDLENGTGASGGLTNDSLPGGGAVDDEAPPPNARPSASGA